MKVHQSRWKRIWFLLVGNCSERSGFSSYRKIPERQTSEYNPECTECWYVVIVLMGYFGNTSALIQCCFCVMSLLWRLESISLNRGIVREMGYHSYCVLWCSVHSHHQFICSFHFQQCCRWENTMIFFFYIYPFHLPLHEINSVFFSQIILVSGLIQFEDFVK